MPWPGARVGHRGLLLLRPSALSWFRIRELTRDIIPLSEPELDEILQRIAQRFKAVAGVLSASDALPDIAILKSNSIEQLKQISQRLGTTGPAEPAHAVRKGHGAALAIRPTRQRWVPRPFGIR